MKILCKNCFVEKEATEFPNDLGGKFHICKSCIKKGRNKKIKYKVCNNCFYKLPITNFYMNNKSEDGYSNICKACNINKKLFVRTAIESYGRIICENCGKEEVQSEFYTKNGKPYDKYCKECIKKITSEEIRKGKKNKCRICGKIKEFNNKNYSIDVTRPEFLRLECRSCIKYSNKIKREMEKLKRGKGKKI